MQSKVTYDIIFIKKLTIGGKMSNPRLDRLLVSMREQKLPFVAINPGFNLNYLTGLNFHLMERPVVLFIRQDGKSALVLPALEVTRAEKAEACERLFAYSDDPSTWKNAFHAAADFLQITRESIGVEANQFRFLEMEFVQNSAPSAKIISAAKVFSTLRLCKDQQEIDNMQEAARIAEAGLQQTLPLIKIGMSETEISSELSLQCLRAGAQGEFPFQPIVASGPNSADPHATPTERKITAGDILLFDWGVRFQGYASDITRCFAVAQIDPKMGKIAGIVKTANEAGRIAARPGISTGEVDVATRNVIEQAGFGEYFTHRTGHGLGMNAHEDPYIFSENKQSLQPGMVFTVEPGIYIPGKGGIRIEDDVVITENGSFSLTSMERSLKVIA